LSFSPMSFLNFFLISLFILLTFLSIMRIFMHIKNNFHTIHHKYFKKNHISEET
jgi:hypothetical protein